MTITDILSIGASVIASLGGGAAIVFGMSNVLGKIWADRLMEKERQAHSHELEHLRNSLKLESDEQLASLQVQLDIEKEKLVNEHLDRVGIYRVAIDLVAEIVAKTQMILLGRRGPLTPTELHEFEAQRMQVYAYLAMHAPQSVMDAHDRLLDLLLAVVYDGRTTTWEEFRALAIGFLNEVRKDIGLRTEPIAYRGVR